jgi:hypothetical protein
MAVPCRARGNLRSRAGRGRVYEAFENVREIAKIQPFESKGCGSHVGPTPPTSPSHSSSSAATATPRSREGSGGAARNYAGRRATSARRDAGTIAGRGRAEVIQSNRDHQHVRQAHRNANRQSRIIGMVGFPVVYCMDLLTPIVAYLGTVAAIIAAVAMSYDAFVYRPLSSMGPPDTFAVASMPPRAKPAAAAQTARLHAPISSRPLLAAAAPRAARKRRMIHRSRKVAREQHRHWPLRESRMRSRAHPLPSRFERYAFRYARPSFGFRNEPFP